MSIKKIYIGCELVKSTPKTGGFCYVVRWSRDADSEEGTTYTVSADVFRIVGCNAFDEQGYPIGPFTFEDSVVEKVVQDQICQQMTDHKTELDAVAPMFIVSQKWDGCSDIYLPKYIHFCEPEQLLQLGDLIKYISRKAVQIFIDNHSGELELINEELVYIAPKPYEPFPLT